MNRFQPIGFTDLRFDDGFWNERLRINREVSIPYQYRQCLETGRIDAFRLNWKKGAGEPPHIFWDSDVAKWIEAASYGYASHPDPELGRLLDETTTLIASAQQADGYLNTYFNQAEQENRWGNLRDNHELYCAGHLIEAAVAHFQATGKRTLLDVACRYADYIGTVFGREEGKRRGYCGHEEIELALVRLYHVTSEKKYLELCRYFIEERGSQPFYFEVEAKARGDASSRFPHSYYQAHLPVREQATVTGHAVRAMYLYCAMADLAGELPDATLLTACERLWENICGKQMYVTGGIGSSRHNEGFTCDYDLPNEVAYCETCASVGMVMWNHRLLQLDGDGRYADIMERALYNGVLAGCSLDGTRFFYENPLASRGGHHRQPWFGCACCPSNYSRMIASLGAYVASRAQDGLAIHLYLQGEIAAQEVGGVKVGLKMETRYPWDGRVVIKVSPAWEAEFALRLRIPDWCRKHRIKIAGKIITPPIEKGYAVIRQAWPMDAEIEIDFEMEVQKIEANSAVLMNRGQVAIQRGPLVYCLEEVDMKEGVFDVRLPKEASLQARWDADLLGGVMVIEGVAERVAQPEWTGELYRPSGEQKMQETPLRAIPYCVWDNRQPGAMSVWIAG